MKSVLRFGALAMGVALGAGGAAQAETAQAARKTPTVESRKGLAERTLGRVCASGPPPCAAQMKEKFRRRAAWRDRLVSTFDDPQAAESPL